MIFLFTWIQQRIQLLFHWEMSKQDEKVHFLECLQVPPSGCTPGVRLTPTGGAL